jgi:DNA-binding SARP family transcriptional activator
MPGRRRGAEAGLELRLLGPLDATSGEGAIALGGQKPRALLAVLALEPGRVVSVDRLVEALWPGEPPETAAHAIQVYISQLRKALGAERLVTRAPGYVLELEPERVDIHRFARLVDEGRAALAAEDAVAAEGALREALDLWRGPALVDFLYEPFVQTEIARLEELRLVAVEERVAADLALGRHVELVSELEALVTAQPLRERPRAQLMLALYRSGRQADALAAYRSARDTLLDELGLEPGPDLKQLEAAILRQDESLLLPETAPVKPTMQFRRLVTIVFVDVVESMALADALDPEALGVVLRRYFDTVSAALTRHGGTVEKYAGDSVMAAFGVPVSHEDDALRAARAALEIRAGITVLAEQLAREHVVELEVRIGLEAGEVVATPTDARQRLVTGEAVGVAARLQQSAAAGEIVVGELAGRLIDHAAALEPLGELEIKGKREPVRAYRLVELTQLAPAFESGTAEAPLTGRKRELAALRRSLKRAVDGGSVRVALVAGAPGVGKSRLAAELVRRTRGITALWGRCLSYGDGITYWPLREAVRDASAPKERDAVLAALDAETPPPAPEIALLFRRLCERLARDGPLVLVFDDVHWAEPTFLELLELVAERGRGAILVVCLARDELLEERPDFLEGRENVDRIVLDQLSSEETDVLLDGLGGAILESDQRARIVETAEGNPFFLEQLLALAVEGGLAARELPATVQALLAARLDRLGPGERSVLERGAVVGKDFSAEDVVSLLDPDAVPTADTHLRTLSARGFVRPRGEALTFRHALVREAVYRAAPKRLRAELHERYADRLDETAPDLPELDEFAGYHLEQAYRLRVELGESDRHTGQLGKDAGRRLGAAGVRAWKRSDAPASITLLRRATSIEALETASTGALLSELGIALRSAGNLQGALAALDRAIDLADATEDRKTGARARMERAYVRNTLLSEPGDELLDLTSAAMPVFEAAGDDRLLGRALLLAGWIYGGQRGQHRRRQEAAERALEHYRRSTWPVSTAIGEIANALYNGPTPVPEAVDRCEELLGTEALDLFGRASVEVCLGGLIAQTGDPERARALIASASAAYDELGQQTSGAVLCGSVRGEVDLLAGDDQSAAASLSVLCDQLEDTRAFSHRATIAGLLSEALYRLSRVEEALDWTRVAERDAASDDLDALVLWKPVRAKILARQGMGDEAIALATDANDLAESTDALNRRAKARRDLGDILRLMGRTAAMRAAYGTALELYEAKGNVVAVGQVRVLLDDVALV